MAKINISFNEKNYSIDPASLADATARLEAHLASMMGGSEPKTFKAGDTIEDGDLIYTYNGMSTLEEARTIAKPLAEEYIGASWDVIVNSYFSGDEEAVWQEAERLGVVSFGLTEATFVPVEPQWSVSAKNTDITEAVSIKQELEGIPVTTIPTKGFADCSNLTNVTIPDSVTTIDGRAFFECAELTNVSIGNGVTAINTLAFAYCSKLTSITLPDSVTSVGEQTFRNCTGLTSITIGNRVTSIESGAFYGCSNLIEIYFDGTKSQWNAVEKGSSWNHNVPATHVHCLDGDAAL
jgi:hypothetical protein